MSETESSASIGAQMLEHRRRLNRQRVEIIPAADAAVASAKGAYEAALISSGPAESLRLKAGLAAAQDQAETERHRLAAMERRTAELESDERAARIAEKRPICEAACREYVAACEAFHEHLAALPGAVKRAQAAIVKINEARLVGVPLAFDMPDLNPAVNSPHRPQPAELALLLMTPDAAANILQIEV